MAAVLTGMVTVAGMSSLSAALLAGAVAVVLVGGTSVAVPVVFTVVVTAPPRW